MERGAETNILKRGALTVKRNSERHKTLVLITLHAGNILSFLLKGTYYAKLDFFVAFICIFAYPECLPTP